MATASKNGPGEATAESTRALVGANMKLRQIRSTTFVFLMFLLWGAVAPLSAQKAGSSPASNNTPAFAGSAPLTATGRAVARVNGAVLSDRDLLREMYTIFPYARQHNGAFPKAMEPDIRQGALKMIEFEELVYQEAQRRKMTIAAARLNRAEIRFRQQFPTSAMYQTYLNTECHGSRQVLRAKIRRSMLIEDFLRVEVTNKAAVSVAQARIWYDKHPEQFRIPESYGVQTISAMAPDKATPQQLKDASQRAENDLRQAKATKTYQEFGLLAEKISEDDYRVMMGDHRIVPAAKLPPEILTTVRKMQPGQVSDVVQVEQVFTIIRLNKHVAAGTTPFGEVRDALRQELQGQNAERLRAALNQQLRRAAKIEEL
jgi:parvulin-like peptidyl-prolyl isomerase